MKKNQKVLKTLWLVMSKKERWQFVFLIFLGIVASFAVLVPTQIISIIVSAVAGEQAEFFGIPLPNSWSITLIIILGAIITFLMKTLNSTYNLQTESLIKKAVCNLRSLCYSQLITPRKNMDLKMNDGDALYRMNDGPNYIVDVVRGLIVDIIPDILSALIAFVYVCFMDALSAPILVAGIFLVFLCGVLRVRIEKPISVKTEIASSAVSNNISNSIANLPVINLWKTMSYEQKLFNEKVAELYKQQKKQINLRWLYWILVRIVDITCTFSIIYLCAKRVFDGTMLVGNIVIVVNYVSKVFEPIKTIGTFSAKWVQCNVKLNRLHELKASNSEVLSQKNNKFDDIETLELKKITVQNGDIFRLENVNLIFKKGEMSVIYGKSGCGKSTITKVICGLCEKLDGEILINGKPLKDSPYTLTEQMSVTMQSPMIFNRDIQLNVLYPYGEMTEKTKNVIEDLGMKKLFVRKFNEQRQQNLQNLLSGGEKKRISIARGLLRDAKIYIFDEPTNDLDNKNAQNVIKQINKLKKNAIVIVVSHDERVMKRADQLIEFDFNVMLPSVE